MPRKAIPKIKLPAIIRVESVVARVAQVDRAALFAAPGAPATERAINLLIVALRDFALCDTDTILARYTFLTRHALVTRLYNTYQRLNSNPDYQKLYASIQTRLQAQKASPAT